ncbi:unnamed protein product [Chondrus crispus]|uniref:BTB domain-containing protein n=1 Tax=Chondrus crispus TaxID=2769 RepID=R7QK62_CHOCR|nr:unnamed protein product [Chondrus crispus]CDF38143.1 unnamed protein product [Chondrus crispus]|eukprot:XP_005718012.1 unnamed protein product [Chondrus crispus]
MISSSPQKLLPSPTKISLPPMPPSTLVGNWILHEHSFAPQREYFMSFCAQLSRRRVVDHLMSFRFPQEDIEPVAVHYSRLALAGGPMAALLREKKEEDVVMGTPGREKDKENDKSDSSKKEDGKGKPVEKDVSSEKEANEKEADPMLDDEPSLVRTPDSPPRKSPVLLSDDDTPRVFNIIVKFLYCEEVQFNYLTFQEVVQLAVAAHRWQLTDLYNATFAYVMDQNLLADGLGIRTFIPLVSHAETPEAFRRYFCIAVGHHFDVLYPRLKAISLTESTAPVSLSVPPLWDVIVSQNMLSHVIHCIGLYSEESYDQYLLDVVLRYYEPKKGSMDEELQGLLSQLNWDEIELSETFASDGPSKNWSARAIRMAALASFDAPQTQALEVRIPWNIPLQKLLKENTWSFQTEHVLCGPYVCYLHVRKGTGPEVSLFVHIWYRDGKPIGADARHESVRVKCRATERNCRCDSGRQWSNTSHGFLENLSFEGKLEGYPGLGWSQFLEAKRIEEWRTSHGEGCGLAITTVLQFMRPKKQFEGPARRSLRAPSPGRVVSAIQKKHSRPSTRMKLRESR